MKFYLHFLSIVVILLAWTVLSFALKVDVKEGRTGTHLTELRVEYLLGHKPVYKEVDEIMAKEDDIMNMQVDMNSVVSVLRDRIITLQGTVDVIAVKLDNIDPGQPRENESKSKKSKKAKQAKPEVPEESDLFTRNLLGVKGAVNDKFDMMERQVKSMESKVESIDGTVGSVESRIKSMESQGNSIEGQVKSIEGKVEPIEKTMEELKDMLSQLMMRGADVA